MKKIQSFKFRHDKCLSGTIRKVHIFHLLRWIILCTCFIQAILSSVTLSAVPYVATKSENLLSDPTIPSSSNSLCITTYGSSSASACDSYTWAQNNNATYTITGLYTATFMNSEGCDSIHTLDLIINHGINNVTSITGCDSVVFGGNTYYNNATSVTCSPLSNGCLQCYGFSIIVKHSTTGSSSVTACDSYTWVLNNNAMYTLSGVYTATFQNAAGCDSVHTLDLIINHGINNVTSVTGCDSVVYGGNPYYNNAAWVTCSPLSNGCLQCDGFSINVKHSTTGSSSVTACDSYTWIQNSNATYSTGGSYTATFQNVAGCDSIHTLHLTINHSSASSDGIGVCHSYLFNGVTYTASGSYTTTSVNSEGCTHSHTSNWTIYPRTYSTQNVSGVLGCYTWSANNTSYTFSGVYYDTIEKSNGCDSVLILNLNITPGVKLSAKVILAGPYSVSSGLMHDSLRIKGLIPPKEPYTDPPFNKTPIGGVGGPGGNGGYEMVGSGVLASSGNDAIVDWIFIELRDATNSATVVRNKRALIQRDGDIVSNLDGNSPVFFASTPPGNYYVSIKHRNHLGVMSAQPILLVACTPGIVDFRTNMPVYVLPGTTNPPRIAFGGVYTLYTGDANNNKNTKYNGISNDKDAILSALGGINFINSVIHPVYRMEDVNMDGYVKFNGFDNDRSYVLNYVGISTPNSVISQHTPN